LFFSLDIGNNENPPLIFDQNEDEGSDKGDEADMSASDGSEIDGDMGDAGEMPEDVDSPTDGSDIDGDTGDLDVDEGSKNGDEGDMPGLDGSEIDGETGYSDLDQGSNNGGDEMPGDFDETNITDNPDDLDDPDALFDDFNNQFDDIDGTDDPDDPDGLDALIDDDFEDKNDTSDMGNKEDEPTAAPVLGGATLPPAYGIDDPDGLDGLIDDDFEDTNGTGDMGNEEGEPTSSPVLGGTTLSPAYGIDDVSMPTMAPSVTYVAGTGRPTRAYWSDAIPTQSPVEYIANDDDPIQKEENEDKERPSNGGIGDYVYFDHAEPIEDMEHDENVAIALGTVSGIGLLLLIITAHQMLNNPDGCCASICRILVACNCFVVRFLCFPCRLVCGCNKSDRYSNELREGGRYSQRHDFSADLELT
jgi:hypothetical protein